MYKWSTLTAIRLIFPSLLMSFGTREDARRCQMMNYDYTIIVNLAARVMPRLMSFRWRRASLDCPASLDRPVGDWVLFYSCPWPVVSDPRGVELRQGWCALEHRLAEGLLPVTTNWCVVNSSVENVSVPLTCRYHFSASNFRSSIRRAVAAAVTIW